MYKAVLLVLACCLTTIVGLIGIDRVESFEIRLTIACVVAVGLLALAVGVAEFIPTN